MIQGHILRRFSKSLILSFCLLCSMVLQAHHLELGVGGSKLLKLGPVDRVAIASSDVLEVTVLEEAGEILLLGSAPGITDLRIWLSDGKTRLFQVEVHDPEIMRVREVVDIHLKGYEGLDVSIIGKRIIIEGFAQSPVVAAKVELLTEIYPQVIAFVGTPPFQMQSMIYLDVKFLEIRRSVLKEIGVDWSDVANGFSFGALRDLTTNGLFRLTGSPADTALPLNLGGENGASFLGYSTRLDSVINLLDNDGLVRVLAEPRLGSVNGGSADFLAGGELPIPVTDEDGALNVQFKEYGIILNISPQADQYDNVLADINVEVSTIDPSTQVLGVPGFLTRRATSQVNVPSGETLVLSGLVSSNQGKNIDRVPGLGDIPIIGELFKSREFRDDETELIVLVTPFVDDGEISDQGQTLFDELNEEAEKELKYNILD